MPVLGISGYAGSGKDLVARLIQFQNLKRPIDTVFEITLNDIASNSIGGYHLEANSGWAIKKFSGALKQIASILTGIPEHKFEDQDYKMSLLGPEWAVPTTSILNSIFTEVQFNHLMTVREFLQKLGTDAVRDNLHPNAWVNAAMANYKENFVGVDANGSPIYQTPNWIFTDCRFPNEAQAIKDKGGYVIRVDRPGIKPVNDHPSETAMDDWDFDYKIFNASDVTSLNQSVYIVMEMIKRNNLWQTN